VDGVSRQAFEETTDCSTHADLYLGDAEGKEIAVFTAALVAVLPDQIYVVDTDYLVAIDVDDLLVEEVALQQEVAIVLGQGLGMGRIPKLQTAAGGEQEVGDRDEGGAGSAFGRGELENQAMDVSGVDQRRDGKLANLTEGGSRSVDYDGPHEGGDACLLIVLRH
jgi:hypothetical protein